MLVAALMLAIVFNPNVAQAKSPAMSKSEKLETGAWWRCLTPSLSGAGGTAATCMYVQIEVTDVFHKERNLTKEYVASNPTAKLIHTELVRYFEKLPRNEFCGDFYISDKARIVNKGAKNLDAAEMRKMNSSVGTILVLKAKGPRLFVLPSVMTAAELYGELEKQGLKSVELDDCWRGDTTGVRDAYLLEPKRTWEEEDHHRGQHAAAVYHSFAYTPEVVCEKDKYTAKCNDSTIVERDSDWDLKRWNPFMCGKQQTAEMKRIPVPNRPQDAFGAGDNSFEAGDAIWVTNK